MTFGELGKSAKSHWYSAAKRNVLDHVALLKPRVMVLVIFTGGVGFVLPSIALDIPKMFLALTAMAMGAAACGSLNMWYDADIDAIMARTNMRPVPRGVVGEREALVIGLVLAVLSVALMYRWTNALAAGLLAATIAIYVPFYTMYLKRRTPQNIVLGGAAGALPPLIGWAAATGQLDFAASSLFWLIFIWTPPHFWALAIFRVEEYRRVGVPMMPVVAGRADTCRQVLLYSLLLGPVSLLPLFIGRLSFLYAVVAFSASAVFIWFAIALYRLRDAPDQALRPVARRLFFYSIAYLFGLFLTMSIERALS